MDGDCEYIAGITRRSNDQQYVLAPSDIVLQLVAIVFLQEVWDDLYGLPIGERWARRKTFGRARWR